MSKSLLLLTFLFFVSCDGGINRIVPVTDDESSDSESRVGDDADNGSTAENGDSEEVYDVDEAKNDDDLSGESGVETDSDDDPDWQNPDMENPDGAEEQPEDEPLLCGEIFDGANCSRAVCETTADCCGADLCVATDACGGAKVCRNAFFKENFDSYVAGNFPNEKWILKYNGAGDSYQIVTSEKYVSAENSMHLLGLKGNRPGSGWASVMTSVLPQVPDVINIEMQMNTEGDDVYFALCTFENEKSGENWGNYDVKVEFADGKLRYQIPEWIAGDIMPSYEPGVWYKIRLKLDQVNKIVSVWVNDELKADRRSVSFDSIRIPNICLSSNKEQKKVWFDDIFVWAE